MKKISNKILIVTVTFLVIINVFFICYASKEVKKSILEEVKNKATIMELPETEEKGI